MIYSCDTPVYRSCALHPSARPGYMQCGLFLCCKKGKTKPSDVDLIRVSYLLRVPRECLLRCLNNHAGVIFSSPQSSMTQETKWTPTRVLLEAVVVLLVIFIPHLLEVGSGDAEQSLGYAMGSAPGDLSWCTEHFVSLFSFLMCCGCHVMNFCLLSRCSLYFICGPSMLLFPLSCFPHNQSRHMADYLSLALWEVSVMLLSNCRFFPGTFTCFHMYICGI